jgi:hypothetical protein
MPWTDPSTHIWATGEILTAANMVTYVEANLAFLYGDAGWTAPAYTNSWVDFGAPNLTVAFRLVGNWVELRGTMKSGTINAAAFTLPAGYRPTATAQFAVPSNSLFGMVSITSAGVVTPVVGSNVSVSLDGIHFCTI